MGNTKTNYMIVTQESRPGQQLRSQSSPGERNGKFSQNSKLGHLCTKLYDSRVRNHVIVHLGLNISI